MIASKHITKIVAILTALAVLLCLAAVGVGSQLTQAAGDKGIAMDYATALFSADAPIEIDIQIDQEDWDTMLSQATKEEYYCCDVVINGETFSSVAIRPKGNTSLTTIASDPTTDRYSFKLEFDHYVEGQTCYGLDKLVLNNNYADATNMKEAIIYDMYQYLGADASLYAYAKVSVNGSYWGVYLALEGVEDSFMLRNYGTENGNLYKPEGLDGGSMPGENGQGQRQDGDNAPAGEDTAKDNGSAPFQAKTSTEGDFTNGRTPGFTQEDPPNMADGAVDGETPSVPDDGFTGEQMPSAPDDEPIDGEMPSMPEGQASDRSPIDNFPGGGQMDDSGGTTAVRGSSGGADLRYTDDALDSYSTIWEGTVTSTTDSDHRRVVTALKNIHVGEDLETYLDTDNVLKYMAVHTFSVNEDSLSGNMAHNYYLYEAQGKLNILPWDYNLAFGGMGQTNATDVINSPIDTPFSGTDFFDTLLENPTYLAQYHSYLRQLAEEYVAGGQFTQTVAHMQSQIDELVQTDPTAFYTAEEYTAAVAMLKQVVSLRAESISGQLEGTIPSTAQEQRQEESGLLSADDLDLSVMGVMQNGGRGNEENNQQPQEMGGVLPTAAAAEDPVDFGRQDAFGSPAQQPSEKGVSAQALLWLGGCLALAVAAILLVKLLVRRR